VPAFHNQDSGLWYPEVPNIDETDINQLLCNYHANCRSRDTYYKHALEVAFLLTRYHWDTVSSVIRHAKIGQRISQLDFRHGP